MSSVTLSVVDRISQSFFCSTPKGSYSSMPFRFCSCLHRFQRYSHSNSKAVVKRTRFWTFFALPNFKGAVPPKVVCALSPQPKTWSFSNACNSPTRAILPAASSAKVSSGYTPNSQVIRAHLLHFKPILTPF